MYPQRRTLSASIPWFVKTLVRQLPGLPDLFRRPCNWFTLNITLKVLHVSSAITQQVMLPFYQCTYTLYGSPSQQTCTVAVYIAVVHMKYCCVPRIAYPCFLHLSFSCDAQTCTIFINEVSTLHNVSPFM